MRDQIVLCDKKFAIFFYSMEATMLKTTNNCSHSQKKSRCSMIIWTCTIGCVWSHCQVPSLELCAQLVLFPCQAHQIPIWINKINERLNWIELNCLLIRNQLSRTQTSAVLPEIKITNCISIFRRTSMHSYSIQHKQNIQ